MTKTRLLCACAPFALCAIANPAFAQDTTPPASGTATSATDGQDSTNSGDIVISATRRSETLANVPLAVSAITGESLQNSGATDIRQLNQLAPSLLVSSTGSEANGSARIRGIGTVGDNPGLESSVAVFIDGVYRSRTGSGLNDLGELDRIEVLRGPQGTLFGRNASAGLLNIITKKPSFTFGGGVEGTYGNYDFFRLSGGITGPITSTIAARLDGVWALEFWAQNLLDQDYKQVAFSTPFQGSNSVAHVQAFGSPSFATANQTFSAFLAEPRTYGATARFKF